MRSTMLFTLLCSGCISALSSQSKIVNRENTYRDDELANSPAGLESLARKRDICFCLQKSAVQFPYLLQAVLAELSCPDALQAFNRLENELPTYGPVVLAEYNSSNPLFCQDYPSCKGVIKVCASNPRLDLLRGLLLRQEAS
jgi:hypothetical protein